VFEVHRDDDGLTANSWSVYSFFPAPRLIGAVAAAEPRGILFSPYKRGEDIISVDGPSSELIEGFI